MSSVDAPDAGPSHPAIRRWTKLAESPEYRERQELEKPTYEVLCEKCKKPFEKIMTISEREKSDVKCPTCKGTKVTPQFGGFVAQTKKKS